MTSFIHERADLDKFPWQAAADIDFGNAASLIETRL